MGSSEFVFNNLYLTLSSCVSMSVFKDWIIFWASREGCLTPREVTVCCPCAVRVLSVCCPCAVVLSYIVIVQSYWIRVNLILKMALVTVLLRWISLPEIGHSLEEACQYLLWVSYSFNSV